MSAKNADSSRKGKQGSTPSRGSHPSPGRGNNRPNARTPNVAHDFDKKHHNNPPVRFNLVFPGHPELTKVFSRHTIPNNRFVCGRNHASADAACKQAIHDIIARSLSQVAPLGTVEKDAFSTIVERHYTSKSIGAASFRFAPKDDPTKCFAFSAAVKHIVGSPDKDKAVLCFCPEDIAEHIWDLTDHLLADRNMCQC